MGTKQEVKPDPRKLAAMDIEHRRVRQSREPRPGDLYLPSETNTDRIEAINQQEPQRV